MTALGSVAQVGPMPQASALQRVTLGLLVLMVAANVLYLVGLVASGGATNTFVNVWLALATQWVPVTIFWLVASRRGPAQLAVILAAAGVTASAIGDTYYTFAMDAVGFLPFPSLADPAYLLFYPLMVAALVLLVRRRLSEVGRLILLETAIATVGAATLLSIPLGPVIDNAMASDSTLEAVVALAYPLFDLFLIAVVGGIAAVPSLRTGRRWWALFVGLSIFIAGDVLYALLTIQDAYFAGNPLDATWAIGLAFITWWALGVSRTSPLPAARPPHSNVFSLGAVAVLAGLVVLIIGSQVHLHPLAVSLAALTVGLGVLPIVFRQAMLGRMLDAQEQVVQRLTELDLSKTNMLVTVNHEFRTPLTSINGHVELLLDGSAGKLSKAALDTLRTIERNGAKLQGLIDETFASARLDSLGVHTTQSPTDIADLVTRAAAKVDPEARRRGISLRVDTAPLLPPVAADSADLEKAITNVIDNAVKFTGPTGKVAVSLHGSATADEVVIRVRDTGIGVPADDIPLLFSRFFRSSNARSAAIPGVGLGLSISQQVIRAHGGTIAVDSVIGEGTTVTVRLPASTASPA